jgi:hypothetical protein
MNSISFRNSANLLAIAGVGILLAFAIPRHMGAQEEERTAGGGFGATTAGTSVTHEGEKKAEAEKVVPPFVEAVTSDEFRSISMNLPLSSGLHFEVNYFGGEHANVGEVGGAWKFGLGKSVALMPGFGVLFGTDMNTAPALTFRWMVEKDWFVTEGHFVQSLRKSEHGHYEGIWDGNHVSVRWERLEVGPTWERIRFREEEEWKRGGRMGVRIFRNVTAVLFVLAPGKAEFRGGIVLHPGKE